MHRGEQEREAGEIPHQLAEAGAAYANVGDQQARSRRNKDGDEEEPGEDESGDEVDQPGEGEGSGDDAGEGEASGDEPEAEGGAD